jgi:hypothetical protein
VLGDRHDGATPRLKIAGRRERCELAAVTIAGRENAIGIGSHLWAVLFTARLNASLIRDCQPGPVAR